MRACTVFGLKPGGVAPCRSRASSELARSAALALFALLLSVACGGGSKGGGDGAVGAGECMRDPSDGPEKTIPYQKGQMVDGFICPQRDQDWYAVQLAAGESLLNIDLEMSTMRSPVQPTYAIYGSDISGGL